MGIVAWVALGLLAGLLARLIMAGKEPGGIIITILLGIAGALEWPEQRQAQQSRTKPPQGWNRPPAPGRRRAARRPRECAA